MDLQPDIARRRLHVGNDGLCTDNVGRIDEYSNTSGSRQQLTQKSEPLCH